MVDHLARAPARTYILLREDPVKFKLSFNYTYLSSISTILNLTMSSKSSAMDAEIADASFKNNNERARKHGGRTIYKWHWLVTLLLSTALIVKYSTLLSTYFLAHSDPYPPNGEPICPQVQSQTPVKHADLHSQLKDLYSSEEFKLQVVELLSGAIKLPTVSHDEMGPIGKDPRWRVFRQFHNYLRDEFPLMCVHDAYVYPMMR